MCRKDVAEKSDIYDNYELVPFFHYHEINSTDNNAPKTILGSVPADAW